MNNQLTEFLKYLQPEDRKYLSSAINIRGKQGEVWKYALKVAASEKHGKEKGLERLQLTQSHFDKICSELLRKCYTVLVPEGGITLVKLLSSNVSWVKHFYNEIAHQMTHLDSLSKAEAQTFLRQCILMHWNMSMMYRNDRAFKKMGQKYLSLSSKSSKKADELFIAYRELYTEIDHLFAEGKLESKEAEINKKLQKLSPDFKTANEETVYEYYWTLIYLKHAAYRYNEVLAAIDEALQKLNKPKEECATQLHLKRAETLYYVGRFEESYNEFKAILKTNEEVYENIGYFYTKYLQISLITGHFETAKWILDYKKKVRGEQFRELIIPRDIISFAKYYLLTDEYETAADFIQLGFIKNPKARYLQYEIELRMLETACFYLSGEKYHAIRMCDKHIKYLRSHGFTIKESFYPVFYVIIKAFFDKGELNPQQQEMLNDYLSGSRAVYGRILQKIAKA